MLKTQRKRRSDRNHAIYVITNIVTSEQYVGITVINSTVKMALHVRIRKHIQRANTENKNWGLCESIRTYGNGAFTYGLLEIVRGKSMAHSRETAIINEVQPKLNTFGVK
jgi:hypothetical protein